MIYMVEITIGDPVVEIEWNAWYATYLKVLLGLPGFQTGQRFKIPGSSRAQYMAMYTVASPAVFESAQYKAAGGGGNASARFRPAYKDWRRNLFEAPGPAPNVPEGHVLLVADRPSPGGAPFDWLTTVGLHKTTPFRGLAVLPATESAGFASPDQGSLTLYAPITPQLSAA